MIESIEFIDYACQQFLDPALLPLPYTRPMDIGAWVKESRVLAKLNQTQLGERLGVGKGNVSAWENGRHEPSYSQMLKIYEVTGRHIPLPGISAVSWPFPDIDQNRINALLPEEIREVQAGISTVLGMIESREAKTKASGTGR